ncbi:MAG: hypothetical protein IH945_12725, partial [Armatimonadetes bacterium]|nr:hypothetical protein [Armatimonadota bacterium]
VIEQTAHEPVQGRWNTALLFELCNKAAEYAAAHFKKSTVGIDTWGVDHGFLDKDNNLVEQPVAYRDESHVKAFKAMVQHRRRLFELTGIQHQPFNTVYQLAARREEHPDWPAKLKWLLLPDLFGLMLTGQRCHEQTMASSTQLLGLDGKWSEGALEIAGWPVPDQPPRPPGRIVGQIAEGVELASVASHDTASAVCGLGTLGEGDVFLNAGTWNVLGTVLDEPLASRTAEEGNWTNERAHDGRVRFLKNTPGFYVVNRLHDELGVKQPVAEWLQSADLSFGGKFDYFSPDLFNPKSMPPAVLELASKIPTDNSKWAAMALGSMVAATVPQPAQLGELVGRQFTRMRVAGGGSQSEQLCQGLADGTGLEVVAGPVEATLLGNLGMQFVAAGAVTLKELPALIDRSCSTRTYEPGALV